MGILINLAAIGGLVMLIVLFRMRERYYTRTGLTGRVRGSGRGVHPTGDPGAAGMSGGAAHGGCAGDGGGTSC